MAKTDRKDNLEVTLAKDKHGIYAVKYQDKSGHREWEFDYNPMRDIIPKLAFARAYQFLSTSASPAALEALAEEHEKPEHRREDRNVFFDNSLMKMYLAATAAFAKRQGVEDISFPLIHYQHSGGHPHWESPRWPVLHIIPMDDATRFETVVKNLHGDDGYAIIKRLESPQNYRMLQVDLLRQRRIEPLALEKHLVVGGEMLGQVMNLLCQFKYGTTERSGPGDD
jgi:hypothetical protein